MWLESIRDNEMQQMYARNPHELGRVLECQTRMRSSEMFLRSGIAKIEKDMEIWGSKEPPASIPRAKGFGAAAPSSYDFMYTYYEDGEFKVEFKENRYWLKGANLPDHLGNYRKHRAKEDANAAPHSSFIGEGKCSESHRPHCGRFNRS